MFEDITEWLLRQYKIAKATIEIFKELGLVILRNISDKLSEGQQLAVADMCYAIEYRGSACWRVQKMLSWRFLKSLMMSEKTKVQIVQEIG